MTHGIILYLKTKPPVEQAGRMQVGYCYVGDLKRERIGLIGRPGEFPKHPLGVLYTSGWYMVQDMLSAMGRTELYLTKLYLKKAIQRCSFSPHGWVLVGDNHDFAYEAFYIGLWLTALQIPPHDLQVYTVSTEGKARREDTKRYVQFSDQIENLSTETNFLLNKKAVVVFRHRKTQSRYIACPYVPPNPRRIEVKKFVCSESVSEDYGQR